jgi:hypothetical protein
MKIQAWLDQDALLRTPGGSFSALISLPLGALSALGSSGTVSGSPRFERDKISLKFIAAAASFRMDDAVVLALLKVSSRSRESVGFQRKSYARVADVDICRVAAGAVLQYHHR